MCCFQAVNYAPVTFYLNGQLYTVSCTKVNLPFFFFYLCFLLERTSKLWLPGAGFTSTPGDTRQDLPQEQPAAFRPHWKRGGTWTRLHLSEVTTPTLIQDVCHRCVVELSLAAHPHYPGMAHWLLLCGVVSLPESVCSLHWSMHTTGWPSRKRPEITTDLCSQSCPSQSFVLNTVMRKLGLFLWRSVIHEQSWMQTCNEQWALDTKH